ncbi:uncharacterized protein BYT42DRAFT_641394 [Radiomyces spectabilis]|uniref:uncharacterized protein n=1 Tax=Radiomyces spectabilis TaxID=64574 RepID=UPI00221F16D0|nr:uncharacterized protein BYT42DRAFT_641394 [Radiomyces spectabilis]KAI8390816.1 hypothetical protein BYT42DRAFT_641394 [Radiomyces spectabilis]
MGTASAIFTLGLLWMILVSKTRVSCVHAQSAIPSNSDSPQYSIPASWAIAGNGVDIFRATNACTMLTSPAVGAVYQTTSSLAFRWLYDKAAIDAFLEINSGVTFSLSLSWIDNAANETHVIASNIDPGSGVYLWDVPTNMTFNKRIYAVLTSEWIGLSEEQQTTLATDAVLFSELYGLSCYSRDQIAGPFTILPELSRFFFMTGPDPGICHSQDMTMNTAGRGFGYLENVPMGRLFFNVPIPITWYSAIPTISSVDLYLVPTDSESEADWITVAKNLSAVSARFYYGVPDNLDISTTQQYRIMLYAFSSSKQGPPHLVSWAADGPYTITHLYRPA